jgi:quinol monooxygenase YgiN
MFARIAKFQITPDKLDEAINTYQDSIIPDVRAQKGYHSSYLLVDRAAAHAVSVAFWDSKEDMMATEESGAVKEWISRFNEYLAKPITTERYEVCAQG